MHLSIIHSAQAVARALNWYRCVRKRFHVFLLGVGKIQYPPNVLGIMRRSPSSFLTTIACQR